MPSECREFAGAFAGASSIRIQSAPAPGDRCAYRIVIASSNGDRQVDLLGEKLGFRHRVYFGNVKVRGGGEYGNAILSRFPILDARNIDFTIPPKKRRGALHAKLRVRLPSGHLRTVHVYALDLGLSGIERKIQLRRFLASHPFATLDSRAPIVLGGDFNDV